MAEDPPPIIKVDPDGAGRAPILSYNVPDSTSYSGRNIIRLVNDPEDSPFIVGVPVPLTTGAPGGPPGPVALLGRDDEIDLPREPPFGEPKISATVRVTSPQADTTVTASGTSVPLAALVEVRVTPAGFQPSRVAVRFGSQTVTATQTAPRVYLATWPAPAGTTTLVASAVVDGATYESAPRTVQVVLSAPTSTADSTPPAISDLVPADGTAFKLDPTTSTVPITVRGRVIDDSGAATVAVQLDGGPEDNPALQSDGTFSSVLTAPTPGQHRIEVRAADAAGNRVSSSITVNVLQQTMIPRHELIIAEYLRLSNFLGAYGAGRTVQTFSLLPGERTNITIKTFKSTTVVNSSTSSFLDSFSGSSSTALEDAVNKEQTTKSSQDDALKASASVEAAGNWGVASAKVSGSLAYGTNSARESLGKSVMNAVSKHANEVSSKRDVKIDTAGTSTTVATDEQIVERTLENINVSRTLNFVFRQMNQEFISVLHMVDVRIGLLTRYVDELGQWVQDAQSVPVSTYREVTLPQLDALLAEVVQPEFRSYVRSSVLAQLDTVVDWSGKRRDVVEWTTLTRPARDPSGVIISGETITEGPYLRFAPAPAEGSDGDGTPGVDTYTDETGNSFDVPGVIIQARKVTLRTDGIMVDAILGGGNALDPYSTKLQNTAIAAKETANAMVAEELARQELARSIVEGLSGAEALEAYRTLFLPVAPDGA